MADERTEDIPINVNEEIQDRTIRHMVFLERFKKGEIRRIRAILDNEIIPSIEKKLQERLAKIIERGSDLGPVTTSRLKQLETELKKLHREMGNTLKAATVLDLTDLTRDEIDWQINSIKETLGFDLDFIVPNPRSVARIIKTTSFAGLTLDSWFTTVERSTQRNVMTAVNRGIVEGETTEQIIRRIRGTKRFKFTDGVMQTTRRQAEAITRTAISHISNQARLEFFKENADIIKSLKWVATLDLRTCILCAPLDGKVFPIDKGPRPPRHVKCRCAMTAVLKSAKEIGLNRIPEGKRSAIDGQVPGDITYGKWLKKQPLSLQEDVLGIKKARLFNAGKLPIEKFLDARLKPLTLKQLRLKEKKAFNQAGL